jgi:antitoxin PrlF
MPLQSTMTSKGQVTVPVEIRRRLGLRQGDRVEFSEKGSDTVIRRAPDSKNPFERYKGALKGVKGDLRAINRWLASLRDEEETGR